MQSGQPYLTNIMIAPFVFSGSLSSENPSKDNMETGMFTMFSPFTAAKVFMPWEAATDMIINRYIKPMVTNAVNMNRGIALSFLILAITATAPNITADIMSINSKASIVICYLPFFR